MPAWAPVQPAITRLAADCNSEISTEASAACAIQNLWLAARAEGLGVGWVSMFDPVAVAQLLGMPAGAQPIALLCIGPVPAFYDDPMLQQERWAQRCPLDDLLFEDRWGQALERHEE